MLTLHPRLAGSAAWGDEAAAGEDHDEGRVCYCVVVACVSLLLFVVLAAATTVAKASAITATIVLLLALAGWLVPSADAAAAAAGGGTAAPSRPAGAVRLVVHHHRCACGLAGDAAVAAMPAFAYEPPAKGGGDKPRGSSVLCAVCLEDVQAGEMVRQLPACRHLFHAGCVDAWLRAHRTCPLCRRELLSPRSAASKAAVTPPPPSTADDDALPPV